MLKVERLRVEYAGIPAVQSVDVNVGVGEYVGIIGSNGAGKTTLLKAISGVVPTQAGEVSFDGRDLSDLSGHDRAALGIVHVPQGRRIFAEMSVAENLRMGAYRSEARKRFDEGIELVHDLFPLLHDRSEQMGGSLSGGQQQMLAIGRGLMAWPKLLMLDEPSMGLAPVINEEIFEALLRLRDIGDMSVVLVEQNAHEALEVCDRAYVLESGSVVMEGPTPVLMKEAGIVSAYLGG